jgi:hypothetical protein
VNVTPAGINAMAILRRFLHASCYSLVSATLLPTSQIDYYILNFMIVKISNNRSIDQLLTTGQPSILQSKDKIFIGIQLCFLSLSTACEHIHSCNSVTAERCRPKILQTNMANLVSEHNKEYGSIRQPRSYTFPRFSNHNRLGSARNSLQDT